MVCWFLARGEKDQKTQASVSQRPQVMWTQHGDEGERLPRETAEAGDMSQIDGPQASRSKWAISHSLPIFSIFYKKRKTL